MINSQHHFRSHGLLVGRLGWYPFYEDIQSQSISLRPGLTFDAQRDISNMNEEGIIGTEHNAHCLHNALLSQSELTPVWFGYLF